MNLPVSAPWGKSALAECMHAICLITKLHCRDNHFAQENKVHAVIPFHSCLKQNGQRRTGILKCLEIPRRDNVLSVWMSQSIRWPKLKPYDKATHETQSAPYTGICISDLLYSQSIVILHGAVRGTYVFLSHWAFQTGNWA